MNDIKKVRYDTDIILDTFSLNRSSESCAELDVLYKPSDNKELKDVHLLEECRQLLLKEGDFWNEEELKMQFLALLFHVTQINEPNKIKTFYERALSATINEHKLTVICDMLLATPLGIGTPRNPYFFLQEFKRAKNAPDAEGQMLVAMLIAQHTNHNGKPVYGCWIQGKAWTFTTLHGKNYCISRLYDASQKDDLMMIVNMLVQLKFTILHSLID